MTAENRIISCTGCKPSDQEMIDPRKRKTCSNFITPSRNSNMNRCYSMLMPSVMQLLYR